MGDAGVSASHVQGAVGTAGANTCGGVAVGAGPGIGGACLLVHGQVDGLTHAVRAVVVHDAGQDATVGGAGT